MDIQKRELWDRLENEPERPYRAFECFLSLPSDHRTIVEAYRVYVGNSGAVKPSDTWTKWSRDYAWRERAAAYDGHLASLRREAHEQVLKDQAEREAREFEKIRDRMHEILTVAYMQAMECLEDEDWVRDNLRSSDVMRIIGLHMDYVKAFEVERESTVEDDWSEEDLAAGEQIMKEIEARRYLEHPDGKEEDGEDSDNTESDLI